MEKINKENVVAVITTYNDYEKTIACLEKVHKQIDIPSRIVVVDNGSQNHYIDSLLKKWKDLANQYNLPEPKEFYASERITNDPLILLRLSENEGYPAALNSAINFLLYDKNCTAFWFMHNDTLPKNYTLSSLLHHSVEESKKEQIAYHIIGTTVLEAERENLMCAGGGTFSKYFGKVRLLDEGIFRYNLPPRKSTIENLDFIYGASMLIRREVFEKIGLFNEKLFLFFEDVEFSIRAKQAGFNLNWAPGAVVRHIGPVPGRAAPVRTLNPSITESEELPQTADYYNIRNRFYLLKKFQPRSFFFALYTLPLILSTRWFKGQKSRFNNVLKAVSDGIKLN